MSFTQSSSAYLKTSEVPMLRTLFRKARTAADAAWNSRYYLPALFILSAAATVTQTSFAGMCLLVLIAVLMLIFCDDLMSITAPVCFILQISVEYYSDYSRLVPYMMYAIVPFSLALIFNLIYYRRRMVFGRLTLPYIAVTLALILGGAGTVTAQDYLKPISLYYMLALGLGQLAMYLIFRSRLENARGYDRAERLAQTMYAAGLLFVVVILTFYAQNLDRFLERGSVLFYKPRNYLTTMLLMCLPSGCMLVRRSNLYLIGMALMYLAMVLTGSRSGLLFGALLLILCTVYIYINNPRSRRLYNWLFGLSALLALIAVVTLVPQLYASRMDSAAVGDRTRLEFIRRGIENFLSHPLLGIGIGSTRDLEIFKAYIPGCMVFYHNALIQIISSMGLLGVGAYGWMLASRLRLLLRGRRGAAAVPFALSYLGLLLMSMTNPGIFCPFPELGLLTLMFSLLEPPCIAERRTHGL